MNHRRHAAGSGPSHPQYDAYGIMSTVQEKLQHLREQNAHVNQGGGEDKLRAQHKAGKMTAHERLHLLFDRGFYDELYRFVQHNATTFGMQGKDLPADGVVTGLGAINGRLVYVSSQDFSWIRAPPLSLIAT